MTIGVACMAGSVPGERRGGRGIVLLIALAVMAAMSLAGVALVRAVDTATAVAGNLAFREAAVVPSNAALEDALAALFESHAIEDREHDLPARGYYASRIPGEDARGVPLVLQNSAPAAAQTRAIDGGNGNTVRYVIERLCSVPGPVTAASCNLAVPYVAAGPSADGTATPAPTFAVFRVTARVDGPQGTVALVQMMLRDGTPPQRLSWRTLSE